MKKKYNINRFAMDKVIFLCYHSSIEIKEDTKMFIIFMVIVVLLLASSARSNKKVKKMHKRYYKRQKQDVALAQLEQWTVNMKKKRGK